MRSPGRRRMIHTRARSFSDSRVEPTHGFGVLASRSNSAAISAGQAVFSERTADLSIIVRAMAFLQRMLAHYIAVFSGLRTGRKAARYDLTTRHRDRRLHERPARRP